MSAEESSFPRLISAAMARSGVGLREVCRRAEMDPSFLSKMLAGKRSPPSEEVLLRRLAAALGLDPVEVIVSAGRIPEDWRSLRSDPELLRAVHAMATGRRIAARPGKPSASAVVAPTRELSEELL